MWLLELLLDYLTYSTNHQNSKPQPPTGGLRANPVDTCLILCTLHYPACCFELELVAKIPRLSEVMEKSGFPTSLENVEAQATLS